MSFADRLLEISNRLNAANEHESQNVFSYLINDYLEQLETYVLQEIEAAYPHYNKLYIDLGSDTLKQLMTRYITNHDVSVQKMPIDWAKSQFRDFLKTIEGSGVFRVHLEDFWHLGAGIVIEWENKRSTVCISDECFVKFPLRGATVYFD